MPAWVYVGAGGFIGAVARWTLSGAITRAFGASFPFGTLSVNLVGSLLIGVLMGLVEYRGAFSAAERQFLIIGALGGFTTFSTFSHETLALVRNGQHALATLNVVGNIGLCLLATAAGWLLAKAVS